MILPIEDLVRDHESIKCEHTIAAKRLEVLIGYTKVEMKKVDTDSLYYSKDSIKKIKDDFLSSAGVAQRTLNRWKKNYKESGIEGLKNLKN